MKKVFTLAFALFICSAAFAQFTNAKSGSRGGNSGGVDFGEMSYKGFVEAGYAIGLGDMKRNRIDVSTSHGVQFGGHFFAGLGTGVKFFTGAKYYCEQPDYDYDDNDDYYKGSKGKSYDIDKKDSFISIPIFADLRANLFEDNSINPFIGLKIGYAIGIEKKKILDDEYHSSYYGYSEEKYCKMKFGGFICTPTIGCRFGINEKMGLNVSMGYDIQKANWELGDTFSYGDESRTSSEDGNVAANGLVFKVGIDF